MSEPSSRPNVAGRLARYFIDSKLTPLLILVAVLAGVAAILGTPREENPEIVVPAANIIVSKPGATPKEIERLVIDPLEAILHGMPGVAHTYGLAENSVGIVTVRFKVGQNKIDSLVKLYDRIMSHLDEMPPGTAQPIVKPIDVDDVPIVDVSLASNSLSGVDLRRLGVEVLAHLRRIDDTSASFVLGGNKREIEVTLDLDRMRHDNITLPQIEAVLRAANVQMPSGQFVAGNEASQVHAGGILRDAHAVAGIVVGLSGHRPVFLGDVAHVTDGAGPIENAHFIGFGPAFRGHRPPDFATNAVTIAVAKRSGTNAVTVAHAIERRLTALRGVLIPDDVLVHMTRDDGARANAAVDTLIEHLGIAITTVVVLLVVFLGWRAAAIVTVTIPLILFLTLAVGLIAGQTINRITLFALILALGLLVDDSIVVIENIYRRYRTGGDRAQEAIAAVNEIGQPTNLATAAVILAFLPMFWVTGMMGPYMRPIPFNVPVAMLISLFVAYTIAPWAARRWLRVERAHGGPEDGGHAPGVLERGYARAMGLLLRDARYRRWFLGALLALLAGALTLPAIQWVKFKMLPRNNNDSFEITVRSPAGSTVQDTARVVTRIGDILRRTPDVTTFESSVGDRGVVDFNGLLRGNALKHGPLIGDVRVHLVDKRKRHVSSIEIVRRLRPAIAALAAESHAHLKIVQVPPGPPVRATVMAEISGPDARRVQGIAGALKKVFETTPALVDVDDSVVGPSRQYTIRVDQTKAALAGIPASEVARTLRTYLHGAEIGTVHLPDEREPVEIRVRIPVADRVSPGDLRKVFFTNQAGNEVPLSAITTVKEEPAPQPIFHKDEREVDYVTAESSGDSPVYAVLHLWHYVATHRLDGVNVSEHWLAPPSTLHYSLRWDGEMRLTLKVFRDLGSAFGVAIVLIYLLLVAYYRSFMIPLIVMGSIPLTLVGVLPGHALLHQYFTATSMIGVIALAGIVVRNSLLLIDFILEYRRAGHSVEEAVLAAGRVRLRPILLTALAIILGTAVMIVDPVFGGLAVSLIFGTFASTVLTLFVIPLGYYAYARSGRS